ncbi:hypothetical protein JCM5353_004063, partial [Sporobolomyces roseus]
MSVDALPAPAPPKRTLEECHKILTGPGMPWEMENKTI